MKKNSSGRELNRRINTGVKTLLGDPKKAIVKLATPMMIGMLVQSLYNLVDGIWVAGLGPDGLSAIGLFFPFFMAIVSLAAGIGVGASSAISRRIGARDEVGADNVAQHSLILTLIASAILMAVSLPFLNQIFGATGAKGRVVELAVGYARILFAGSIVVMFTNVGSGILRGEGDTKRAMYAMITGSGLNIILDPVFIYTFKLGVVGAAWATLVSLTVAALFIFIWLFVKKVTFVKIDFRDFIYRKEIVGEVLKVGIPGSLSQLSMSVAMFFINIIIVFVAGSRGIAVFTSGWRVTMLGIVPLLGMAIATTAVVGASYGAKDINKLRTGYLFAIKLGIVIEVIIATLIFIFAREITFLFTYSFQGKVITDDLIKALRILVFFLPTVPLGMLTSAMFQGIGAGYKSLAVTILRTVVMQILFAFLFAKTLGYGLSGVWTGIVAGNVAAAVITFTWGFIETRRLKNSWDLKS